MADLRLGDCLEMLRELEDCSVDAVVTDPPYGIGFMGHEWDQPGEYGPVTANGEPGRRRRQPNPSMGAGHAYQRDRLGGPTGSDNTTHTLRGGAMHAGRYDLSSTANRRFQAWAEAWGAECWRVLKPGGHLASFGGTRTYHRLACGLEDAGFEIRDCLAWMFGSGFPKSLNLEGEWEGWGTALKPAFEPVVLARKPLGGTVAMNVLAHGTGALNIDATRIGTTDALGGGAETGTMAGQKGNDGWARPWMSDEEARNAHAARVRENVVKAEALGRWPANVLLDEDAAAMLDAQTGVLVSGPESDRGHRRNADDQARRNAYGGFQGQEVTGVLYGDSGGASRFFYCAKVSRAERNAGLDGFEERHAPHGNHEGRDMENERNHLGGLQGTTARNVHPTVKPIDLMRWLIRLITPPGGLVLDPFLGSGSTGCAAALEGRPFVGIEREPDYMEIATARIKFWQEHGEEALDYVRREEAAEAKREAVRDAGQLSFLTQ